MMHLLSWYIVIYHTHSYILFHGGEVATFTNSVIKRRSDSFSHHPHIEALAASQLHCLFQMEMNHHLPHTSGTAFFQIPPKRLKSKSAYDIGLTMKPWLQYLRKTPTSWALKWLRLKNPQSTNSASTWPQKRTRIIYSTFAKNKVSSGHLCRGSLTRVCRTSPD